MTETRNPGSLLARGAVALTTVSTAAVAGLFSIGMAATPVHAADLGGDCCAGLEERVSDLEATTVRKGNRKVSLKLSGHVNKMIMYWDDGINDDVYIVDNSESETRFRLTGKAAIAAGWTAGFKIEVEAVDAEGANVNQLLDDRTSSGDGDGDDNSDGAINLRKASWHIKNEQLGKITVGRDSPATDDINQLNIAKNPIADGEIDNMRGFHLVRPQGTNGCSGADCRTTRDLGTIMHNIDTRRGNGVRYDTPSLFGLVVSAFYGEDDLVDVALRYRKEWNSIRFIGGIGYMWDTDEDPDAIISCPGGNGQATCVDERVDRERLVGSASVMHTPTGLYAFVSASHDQFGAFHDSRGTTSPLLGAASPADATVYSLQAGIKRRLLAPNLGKTTLYGEYSHWDDFDVHDSASNLGPVSGGGTSEITDSSADLFGFGVVQDIDAAAMKLYLGFRWYETDLTVATAPDGVNVPIEDMFTVQAGGKIKF